MLTIPSFRPADPSDAITYQGRVLNVRSGAFRVKFYSRTRACPTGCVVWARSFFRDGYGQCFFEGRNQRTHRIAWILERGDIPLGMQVLHRCDVPACVNIEHLFLGTTQDNTADKIAKGRARYTGPSRPARGARNGFARLNDDLVRALRRERAEGALLLDLVEKHGIPLPTIHRAICGKTWAHVS